MLRVAEGAMRAVFPEVDAFTKPVIVVGAWRQRLTGQNGLACFTITPVKTQDERRKLLVHLTIGGRQLPALIPDAAFHAEILGLIRIKGEVNGQITQASGSFSVRRGTWFGFRCFRCSHGSPRRRDRRIEVAHSITVR